MSSEKGNASRSRAQKYKNTRAFRNDLYDTNHRTKFINSIQVSDVCARCKEQIEWKIKYKKYKTLTQPKKCIKCEQKTIKMAYHIMCTECGRKLKLCAKCGVKKEIVAVIPTKEEQIKLDAEMQSLLKTLSERKRRAFLRYKNRMQSDDGDVKKEDLVKKLNELNVHNEEEEDDEFGSSEEEEEEDSDELDDELE